MADNADYVDKADGQGQPESQDAALEVRPARAEDRDAVLAFCAHTWADGDYIEFAWDNWLRDQQEQRSVLLLVAVEDLSYADAAKVLGVPVGTVMSRLSRARERLQQEIEGVTEAPGNVVPLRSVK